MRDLKAQSLKSQADLAAQLELAQAHLSDLKKRLFSSKSEQGMHGEARAKAAISRALRGQRRSSAGHCRSLQTQLSARRGDVTLAKPQCPSVGSGVRQIKIPARRGGVFRTAPAAYPNVVVGIRCLDSSRTCQSCLHLHAFPLCSRNTHQSRTLHPTTFSSLAGNV